MGQGWLFHTLWLQPRVVFPVQVRGTTAVLWDGVGMAAIPWGFPWPLSLPERGGELCATHSPWGKGDTESQEFK